MFNEPSSPFSGASGGDPFNKSTPPIPSPFNESPRESYDKAVKSPSPFAEPERFEGKPAGSPFDPPAAAQPMAQAEWTPPPAPDPAWQNKPVGQDTPFQPPPAGVDGQNKTLAIVSLVVSVLSIPCCGLIVFGIVGAVLGFIAKGKADSNPKEYGGRGLALAGIVIGVITTLIGIVTNALALLGYIPIPTYP